MSMQSCRLTGNSGTGMKLTSMTGTALGGTLAAANDIYGNAGQNMVVTGSPVQARYNYWGTVNEDSLAAKFTGSVSYSPWTDSGHSGVYTSSYVKGALSGNVHWSGEVKVVGDVYVPSGSMLTIDPGTTVKVWANASLWDTLSVTTGRCDLIVGGALHLAGGSAPAESVWVKGWLPLQTVPPAAGQWGRIAFSNSSLDDSCRIENAVLSGATVGVRATDASPRVIGSTLKTTSSHGLEASGSSRPVVWGCRITGSGSGTGVSVTGSSSASGLWLEGSTVTGSVVVTGKGRAEVIGNPGLAGVRFETDGGAGDTLWCEASGNVLSGTLTVNSLKTSATAMVELRGNALRSITMVSRPPTSGPWSYLVAEIDSNQVVGTSGDRIQLEAGRVDGNNYCYNGRLEATVRWNGISGGDNGINAYRPLGGVMGTGMAGYIKLTTVGNQISGATRGIRAQGVGDLLLRGDRIDNCQTGVEGERENGCRISLSSATLTGSAQSNWALSIADADSVRCHGTLFENWGSGICLSSCAWSSIVQNDLRGRQQGCGVKCIVSSPEIQGNYIDHFVTGIQTESNANPLVANNSLACAADWGLNNLSPGVTIDARSNWWGGSSGPHHYVTNPGGTGSRVSDNVLFVPWLAGYPNRPPLPFSLFAPPDGAVLDSIPSFDWEDAWDPDCHDVVTYTFYLSWDSTYSAPLVITGIPESHLVIPDSVFFASTKYYWKVKVTDFTAEDSTWCREEDWSFTIPTMSNIQTPAVAVPKHWRLAGAWPNPFSGEANVRFDVPVAEQVRLEVFDATGRCVRVLHSRRTDPGYHRVGWNGRDSKGSALGPGVYFCRMTAGNYHSSVKLVMLRHRASSVGGR